ncbi:eukaryotic translation initiation factor 4 gamma 3-like isoform X1 [Macrobrachium nipponense]|uniref:eukaryotic translation initiation factor 4 gamma 3-like isoform X1 n=2 Tax=Macrobrachium nipponense TaxID=159736 RepID=UPI0030C89545
MGQSYTTMPEGPPVTMGDSRSAPPVLRRCDNPWKPNAQHGQSKQLYRRWMGILNRVTQTSLAVFLEQACEVLLSDPEHLAHFFELLIFKAQDEPLFVDVYARLCSNIDARTEIQSDLIKACENHFTESYQILMEYNKIFEEPVSSHTVYEEILVRQRCIGHLRFVGELHKNGLMSGNHVAAMVETLLQHSDERSLECLCRFLHFTGQELSQTHEDLIEQSCNHIENCLESGSLTHRLRWLIQDTLGLHANGWRPLVVEQGPTRITRDVRG